MIQKNDNSENNDLDFTMEDVWEDIKGDIDTTSTAKVEVEQDVNHSYGDDSDGQNKKAINDSKLKNKFTVEEKIKPKKSLEDKRILKSKTEKKKSHKDDSDPNRISSKLLLDLSKHNKSIKRCSKTLHVHSKLMYLIRSLYPDRKIYSIFAEIVIYYVKRKHPKHWDEENDELIINPYK